MGRNLSIAILASVLGACQQRAVTFTEWSDATPWGEQVFFEPVFPPSSVGIVSYGAKAESGFNNQGAIQKAIDATNHKGGGRVTIPAGRWETSYLELRSNINLVLEEGAVLVFSDDRSLYDVPTFTRWEGIECMNYHPLIYGKDLVNVAITGAGKIDGNGKSWWEFGKRNQIKTLTRLYDEVEQDLPPEMRNCLAYEPTSYLRPSLIQTVNCQNVLIDGIELGSGPMWTVHFVYCDNVIARNLKVITNGVNNDGITPDASKNVLIENCFFSTGDDCIVIKSGLNEDGWRVGKASENIVIRNCRTQKGHGGIVIGSEMSGGVRNVYAHDCDFSHTERGLRFKSMKGRGGVVENLWFERIAMDSIIHEAIQINMFYGSSSIAPRSDSLPTFRNFHFRDITSSYAETAININGIVDRYVDSLVFDDVSMSGQNGIVMNNAANISFQNVTVSAQGSPIRIGNARDILIKDSEFKSGADTLAVVTGDVQRIEFTGLKGEPYSVPFNPSYAESVRVY